MLKRTLVSITASLTILISAGAPSFASPWDPDNASYYGVVNVPTVSSDQLSRTRHRASSAIRSKSIVSGSVDTPLRRDTVAVPEKTTAETTVSPTKTSPVKLRTSPQGISFIKEQEGLVLYVYDDMREGAGEWNCRPPRGTITIGYGHTNLAGGVHIRCLMRINKEEAETILKTDLVEIEREVNNALKVPVTQGQYDAIVSSTFNCGGRHLRRIVDAANDGDMRLARSKFMGCVTAKGQYLQGLADRRHAEQRMWDHQTPVLEPEPTSEGPWYYYYWQSQVL